MSDLIRKRMEELQELMKKYEELKEKDLDMDESEAVDVEKETTSEYIQLLFNWRDTVAVLAQSGQRIGAAIWGLQLWRQELRLPARQHT